MNRRQFLASSAALLAARPSFAQEGPFRTKYFPISSGIGLHDLAPAPGFAAALAIPAGPARLQCWYWRM